MSAPSPLMIALNKRLHKWRRREENDDGRLWHGISHIRQGLGEKAEVRAALIALHAAGRVERFDASNGVYWRAAPVDTLDVRAS